MTRAAASFRSCSVASPSNCRVGSSPSVVHFSSRSATGRLLIRWVMMPASGPSRLLSRSTRTSSSATHAHRPALPGSTILAVTGRRPYCRPSSSSLTRCSTPLVRTDASTSWIAVSIAFSRSGSPARYLRICSKSVGCRCQAFFTLLSSFSQLVADSSMRTSSTSFCSSCLSVATRAGSRRSTGGVVRAASARRLFVLVMFSLRNGALTYTSRSTRCPSRYANGSPRPYTSATRAAHDPTRISTRNQLRSRLRRANHDPAPAGRAVRGSTRVARARLRGALAIRVALSHPGPTGPFSVSASWALHRPARSPRPARDARCPSRSAPRPPLP